MSPAVEALHARFVALEVALKTRARRAAFPLPDGRFVRAVLQVVPFFDQALALTLLKRLGATRRQLTIVKRSRSVRVVREVVRVRPGAATRTARP